MMNDNQTHMITIIFIVILQEIKKYLHLICLRQII